MSDNKNPTTADHSGNGWHWFAGFTDDYYQVGPCASRQEAADAGRRDWPDDAIHLIEARQDPINLASWIGVDSMVEQLHESLADDLGGEDGESPADGAWTAEQEADLEKAIRATVKAWQERHKIVVTPRTFTATRNAERVDAPSIEAPVAAE